MAERKILLYPDPRLKQVARIAEPGEDLERVKQDLLDTMRGQPRCVGLAAPQIGEMVRVAVVDCSEHKKCIDDNNGLMMLVNPRIVSVDGSEVGREGCLSIPHLTANVRRATTVVVEWDGGRAECHGFEARCVLHEIDHLDGLLFLDRVESLTDDVFRRKNYGEKK